MLSTDICIEGHGTDGIGTPLLSNMLFFTLHIQITINARMCHPPMNRTLSAPSSRLDVDVLNTRISRISVNSIATTPWARYVTSLALWTHLWPFSPIDSDVKRRGRTEVYRTHWKFAVKNFPQPYAWPTKFFAVKDRKVMSVLLLSAIFAVLFRSTVISRDIYLSVWHPRFNYC